MNFQFVQISLFKMPITFYPSPENKAQEVYTKEEKKIPHLISGSIPTENYVSSGHGFVDAVRFAYSRHHNLTIRPDDVWIAIATQFSTYIEKNAEELRDKFVHHIGQKELEIGMIDLDFAKFSLYMSDNIAENIKDPKVRKWIMPSFSTTTDTDRVVGAMVLMASMKKYFSYKMTLMCGLPSVTMLGTEEDWVDIANRAKELLKYDNSKGYMKTWYSLLKPILDNFVSSIRGKPDLQWWNSCCTSLSRGSGPRYLSGWLTVFSVYNNDGEWFENCRYRGEHVQSKWPVIESNDLAKGVVTVDVKVDDNGVKYDTVLTAGSSGYICLDKYSIQPCITWTVCHKEKREMTDREKFLEIP
jgi:hypothetical protein